MTHNNSNTMKKAGVSLVLGMAIGYIASLFIPSSTREKHKETLEEKTQQLASILREDDPAQRVKDIFEKNTARVRESYNNIKEEFISKLAELKTSIQDIDRQKYQSLLDSVLDRAKEDKELTQAQLDRMRRYLRQDFEKIKSGVKRADRV